MYQSETLLHCVLHILCDLPYCLQEWNPHFFVLTPYKLYYTDETTFNKQREEEDDDGTSTTTQLEVQPSIYMQCQ